jgi:hypothetical protein
MMNAATLLNANGGEDTIFVHEDETAYFGILLMQMSLKQGLRYLERKVKLEQ